MKALFTVVILLLNLVTFAQRQNVYFFKNNGTQVKVRDSADYTRVVREPDSGSVLYKVFEYYLNGKPRRMALSSTVDPIRLEGSCVSFYENGNKKTVSNYIKNVVVDEEFHFYPNGKLSEVRNYADSLNKDRTTPKRNYLITTFNDVDGKPLLENGNGIYKIYNKDYTKATTQGEVKNGLKDGEWKISVNKDSLLVIETFSKGRFVSGTAKLANGETYTYTEPEKLPEFKGGMQAFYKFLGKTLRYPDEAFRSRTQGKVFVSFIIEKDGSLTQLKETSISPGAALSKEAIRVIALSPKWNPGVQYGRPVRTTYTVPVVFVL